MRVEVIDENDNIIEYKRVNIYAEKYNMIHIDELIMAADGIKEIKLDGESIFRRRKTYLIGGSV